MSIFTHEPLPWCKDDRDAEARNRPLLVLAPIASLAPAIAALQLVLDPLEARGR